MRRFVFELENVLRIKQHRQRLAELRQLQTAAVLEAARAAAAAIQTRLDLNCIRLQEKLGKPQDAAAWLAFYLQSSRLEQELAAAGRKVDAAAADLEAAAVARKRATLEVEVLLALRQRRWQEFRQTQQRAEQEQLDDVGLRRWQARRPGTGTQGARE